MVSSFNVSHGAPIGRTERCFRTEWPPSHVNIASERHFLINPWVSSRDCRIPAITALTGARAADKSHQRGPRQAEPPRRERVDHTMANRILQVARGGMVQAGAVALALGLAGIAGTADAQQPPAAKKPAAAP